MTIYYRVIIMNSVNDIRVVQKLVSALAPEVDESKWARAQPLGVRWLVRTAAAQLQDAAAWSESTHLKRKRKRNAGSRQGPSYH